MVGYITVAHGGAQRLSEKWRHFVVHCLYSLFCTSPRCVGVKLQGTQVLEKGFTPDGSGPGALTLLSSMINTPGTFQNVLERHYTCHTGACAPRPP